MSNTSGGLYTFGSYRLDAASRVLTRAGVAITLAPKTFDLLILMAESGGRLLSKRELMDTLWKGTFVEEANLSFQISTLRKALGEEGTAWIEAVPKHGYRFTAPLEQSAPIEKPHPDIIQSQSVEQAVSRIRSYSWRVWLIAVVAGVLAIAATVANWMRWPSVWKQRTDSAMRVIPATTCLGRETSPTLSPDGSQLAFTWDGEKGDNFDIYVKVVGEDRALRLTSDPRPEFSPVWSPDGRRIAFCRNGESGSEIVLIPALGGPERIVANLPKQADPEHPERPLTWLGENTEPDKQLAWFPDGQFLSVVGRKSQGGPNTVFLLSVNGGEMRPLTTPPDLSWGDGSPSVSPDSHWLAFVRSGEKYPEPEHLYIVRLSDLKFPVGGPQQISAHDTDFAGLAWTPDGRRLVFPSERRLWTVGLAQQIPEPLPLPGYNPSYPAISAKGDRLAFVDSSEDLDIWRVNGPAIANNGPTGPPKAPTRLISSTRPDTNPQVSPDGSRIAFTSSRSGTTEIWVCVNDGSNPVQLTDLKAETGTPRWSPDGRYLAFDSTKSGSPDIYVVPTQGGPVRRMTSESAAEDMPSWSQDGKWIYFESNRSGVFEIWKTPTAGGTAVQVTNNGGAEAFESHDGNFVYYTKWEQRGIWRKHVEGGPETLVIHKGTTFHWGLFEKGACLVDVDTAAGPTISCLDFGSNRMMAVSVLPNGTHINEDGPSFSISPDGRWILYVGVERQENEIMVVENFR